VIYYANIITIRLIRPKRAVTKLTLILVTRIVVY
jgi:hypothetical protein